MVDKLDMSERLKPESNDQPTELVDEATDNLAGFRAALPYTREVDKSFSNVFPRPSVE